jgi:hypothetical protein
MSTETKITDQEAINTVDAYLPRHCRAALDHIASRLRGEGEQPEQKDCGEAGHAEGRCGNAPCVGPQPIGGVPDWMAREIRGEGPAVQPEQQGQAVACCQRIRFDWTTGEPDRPWDSKVITHDEMRERYADRLAMCHSLPLFIAGNAVRALPAKWRAMAEKLRVVGGDIANAEAACMVNDAKELEAALSTQPAPSAPAEDRFEQFVQAEIARSPDALRKLGEYLADVLDEDRFPRANRLLLRLATEYRAPPAPSAPRELPPLPDFAPETGHWGYTAEQMRAYARAALSAPSEQVAASVAVPESARDVIEMLLQVAYRADVATDDSEDLGDGEGHNVGDTEFTELCSALDALELLPDDQPGYVMGPAAKARWALRDLVAAAPVAPHPEAEPGVTECIASPSGKHEAADADPALSDRWCQWCSAMLAAAPKPTAGEDDTSPSQERETTKPKAPRRRVVDWKSTGLGCFQYTLSCGHKANRVGTSPRGFAIEKPAQTCTCYECARIWAGEKAHG